MLEQLAPAGFHLAVRVGFAFPEYEWSTLPLGWVHRYTREALMLYDPVTRWVYENVGCVRWSEIGDDDPKGVLSLAAQHDLTFGVAVCVMDDSEPGIRTYGSFARSDREFRVDEMETLVDHLTRLHHQEPIALVLTPAEIEALHMIRDGLLTKEIAYELDISESAVKQRLRSAKSKLKARTTTHAVTLAERRGLFRMSDI
ncbi:helix-turn-helix transcriptional regulator [Tropicimonas sediminicola]|uniref:Transcriptional regulator, LuxR family n=1 Tax=Tropicimonas sediminicola TaxID=1031541 RepID=A0A239KHA2_9RHOB|nr:LuxR C-terminal-related transcriptional regulator [Tropicimonas sediminicola]SNT16999.1 transcriptional regulator, LuxR family [Tropicimonas sediminicola]